MEGALEQQKGHAEKSYADVQHGDTELTGKTFSRSHLINAL
jgi:hypothetical protein